MLPGRLLVLARSMYTKDASDTEKSIALNALASHRAIVVMKHLKAQLMLCLMLSLMQ